MEEALGGIRRPDPCLFHPVPAPSPISVPAREHQGPWEVPGPLPPPVDETGYNLQALKSGHLGLQPASATCWLCDSGHVNIA